MLRFFRRIFSKISLIFFILTYLYGFVERIHAESYSERETALIHEEEETLLYVSTLNGSFIAVNQYNGEIKWQFKEEAAVKVPVDHQNALMPLFLPDPRDGSLYLLNSDKTTDLKKLQFTIQQLVASSPCRSSDGIFYTGKKVDNWFMVDWRTGLKEELKSSTSGDETCPLSNRNSLFLGRTEYNLIIHDITRSERKWNVTYHDYTSKIIPQEKLKNLEFLYFAGSSSGKFSAMKNPIVNNPIWEADFGSPVIGVYLREGDGLISLPFTTMDENSMSLLGIEFTKHIKLSSTLYIGAHSHGLYALPSFATSSSGILYLNGPTFVNSTPDLNAENNLIAKDLTGYYEIPAEANDRFLISGRNDAVIEMPSVINASSRVSLKNIGILSGNRGTGSENFDGNMISRLAKTGLDYILSSHNIELKVFMVTMFVMMFYMFIYFRAQVMEFKQSSSSGYLRNSSSLGTITALAEELPDGSTKVGKISFDSKQILGKGCEGTFVFKGEFDNRRVAVKRLLPECFTVADREVCLLRESDQHPNVIRYFCMEQDKQFRYIALELCKATLQDYVEKLELNEFISSTDILAQATAGLEHLHFLNIVHRDIKPQNVLLSVPSTSSREVKVRAMISDFGLCKKLQIGKSSFSRKSGVTGTDGWIAPEMIHGLNRTTTAVDVFSLGCVFYYALSSGRHPFGDSFNRQANIMKGVSKLDEINDPYKLWNHIISKMVNVDPQERPSVSVIRNHPAFWSKDQLLTFLQDVSDRIEKEDNSSEVLHELEKGNTIVLIGDWRDRIDSEIADDLRKYRTYRSDSVRDLLRALRNKKHHYRELSDEMRNILGSLPDQFVTYWMDRFPMLLLHTWLAMQCVQHEDVFHKYYRDSTFTFPSIHNGTLANWLFQTGFSSARWAKFSSKNGSPRTNLHLPMSSNSSHVNWRVRRPSMVATGDGETDQLSIGDQGLAKGDESRYDYLNRLSENDKENEEIEGPELDEDENVLREEEELETNELQETGVKKRRFRHRTRKKRNVTFLENLKPNPSELQGFLNNITAT